MQQLVEFDADLAAPGPGVPDDVGDRLVDDPVRGDLDRGRQWRELRGRPDVELGQGVGPGVEAPDTLA